MKTVGIIMGSVSDKDVMSKAFRILDEFEVEYEKQVISAHRALRDAIRYAETAKERGIRILIAGAGGAAHLPGVLAAATTLPVIGVPIQTESLHGMDSLLSIVQMPSGIPVATVAINGSTNAALLAIEILAINDKTLENKLINYREKLRLASLKSSETL